MALGRKTGGRLKGTPNRLTSDLKAAILGALEAQGGQQYLEKVAADDPRTFCALLSKVLPMQLQGDEEKPLVPVLNVKLDAADEIMRRLARLREREGRPIDEDST
jgi:hypothetical protein